MSKRIVVLGLGNILMKDEGIGVHAIRELEKLQLPENVELIDGGTAGLAAFASLKDVEKLIIIDALKSGRTPGTIYRFHPKDLFNNSSAHALSLHQIGVLETIAILEKTGNLPKGIVIVGIEPKEIAWGTELTNDIRDKMPDIIDIVLKELNLSVGAASWRRTY